MRQSYSSGLKAGVRAYFDDMEYVVTEDSPVTPPFKAELLDPL